MAFIIIHPQISKQVTAKNILVYLAEEKILKFLFNEKPCTILIMSLMDQIRFVFLFKDGQTGNIPVKFG